MSRWGIGPQITICVLTYAAVAGVVTRQWPGTFLLHSVPVGITRGIAAVLLVIGVPMLVISARTVMQAYNRDQLATGGMLAIVRHPIYSTWIVFVLPGLVILSRCWLLFLVPFIAYLVFKLRIHSEDEYLTKRFGDAYLQYRKRVREIIPIPRRLS